MYIYKFREFKGAVALCISIIIFKRHKLIQIARALFLVNDRGRPLCGKLVPLLSTANSNSTLLSRRFPFVYLVK